MRPFSLCFVVALCACCVRGNRVLLNAVQPTSDPTLPVVAETGSTTLAPIEPVVTPEVPIGQLPDTGPDLLDDPTAVPINPDILPTTDTTVSPFTTAPVPTLPTLNPDGTIPEAPRPAVSAGNTISSAGSDEITITDTNLSFTLQLSAYGLPTSNMFESSADSKKIPKEDVPAVMFFETLGHQVGFSEWLVNLGLDFRPERILTGPISKSKKARPFFDSATVQTKGCPKNQIVIDTNITLHITSLLAGSEALNVTIAALTNTPAMLDLEARLFTGNGLESTRIVAVHDMFESRTLPLPGVLKLYDNALIQPQHFVLGSDVGQESRQICSSSLSSVPTRFIMLAALVITLCVLL